MVFIEISVPSRYFPVDVHLQRPVGVATLRTSCLLIEVESALIELHRCWAVTLEMFLGISEIFSRFKSILNNDLQWQLSICQVAFQEKIWKHRKLL